MASTSVIYKNIESEDDGHSDDELSGVADGTHASCEYESYSDSEESNDETCVGGAGHGRATGRVAPTPVPFFIGTDSVATILMPSHPRCRTR